MSEYDQSPVIGKYLGNAKGGFESVSTAGFIEFRRHPDEIKHRFGVTLGFTDASQVTFSTRVADVVDQLGTSIGAKFALAGRDFPIHSTVLELRREDPFEDSEEAELQLQMAELSSLRQLHGLDIPYDYIFVDKQGNVILAATKIPNQVLEARDEIAQFGERSDLEPLPLTNILHITVARPTKLPPQDKYLQYYHLEGLRPSLRRGVNQDPFSMTVDTVNSQITWNLVRDKISFDAD